MRARPPLENGGNNDSPRFHYFTPRFSDFQRGISCARNGARDINAQIDDDSGANSIIADTGTKNPESGDEEVDQFLIGVSYKLATGVVFNAYGAYVDFEDAAGGDTVEDVEAFVIGTAIKVDF